jgi:putative ABC transport system permease protein
MKEGFVLVVIGTILGIGAAWAVGRLLSTTASSIGRSMQASASEPLLLVAIPVVLTILALLGCYLPARKAAETEPASVLRQE